LIKSKKKKNPMIIKKNHYRRRWVKRCVGWRQLVTRTFSGCHVHRKPQYWHQNHNAEQKFIDVCDVEWLIWTSHNVCTLQWRWHRIVLHSTTSFSLQYLYFNMQLSNHEIYLSIYIKLAMIIYSFWPHTCCVFYWVDLFFGFQWTKAVCQSWKLLKNAAKIACVLPSLCSLLNIFVI